MSAIKTSKESSQVKKVEYTGKAHTTGGRDGGASKTDDGRLDIKLTYPGTPGTGTNPEQLLAAGWSACFLTNIKIAGGKMKVRVPPEAVLMPKWTCARRPTVFAFKHASTLACRVWSTKLPSLLLTPHIRLVRIPKPHRATLT
jgi:organic hydroperoxide reductase OsmC/OhrA